MKTKVRDWKQLRENAEHMILFILILLSFFKHDLWGKGFGWIQALITIFFLYMAPKCVKTLNKIEDVDLTKMPRKRSFMFIFWLEALLVMFMFPFASMSDFVARWTSWVWTIVYISTYVYNMNIDFKSW